MDVAIGTLVASAAKLVVDGIKKSKIVQKASESMAEKFWKWIKPKIDEDVAEDLETNPDDEDLKVELSNKIKRLIKKDPEFAAELKSQLGDAGVKPQASSYNVDVAGGKDNIVIQGATITGDLSNFGNRTTTTNNPVNQKHSGSGDNIAGDKIIK